MKIICVDNFDRATVSDTLVASGVSEYLGTAMVEALNGRFGGSSSPDYFKLVADDYELYKPDY